MIGKCGFRSSMIVAFALLSGAGLAFAQGTAENFPEKDGGLTVPFPKALHMMLTGDGGGGGIGFTTSGPNFNAPTLTTAQLKLALPGNTIRREQAWAAYFGTDGIVEGWKRDWSKAKDMTQCPGKLGDDYQIDHGECWVAQKNVIHGPYTLEHNQVCMPAYSGKAEDGRACYYIGFVTSFVVIGDGKMMYGGGKDFVAGKVLQSYTDKTKVP